MNRRRVRQDSTIRRALAALAALAMGATVLGGCAGGKADYDAVLAENNELRERNGELESALQEANTRNASLEQENRDLAGRGDGAGGTGFEDINGVRVRRGAGGEVVVDIAGDVLFDSGQTTLKSSARKTLDRVAQVLNSSYSGNMVRVEGYTDSDPIKKSQWKTNERLSSERALAVEEYLVGKGVGNSRVYSAAFGSARPKQNKEQSRRVEIVILAAAGGG